ncbi:zinc-ribbon domain-containing protein [Aggregatimonas sangjinii]|uniref:Zinc-ribbon domain-containing protein n=1 Tax=Aggregatimonas sangjinii TaxID=2583587 RepID=A0A5B7SM60_9FLAO|nr:zinc-ribbon domain-containing protein [Aggregatimonas sangjinii]QCW99171.1 zinc-ribbon domain-containing protein [Aggregatimonas sangjinii]
MIFFFGTRAAKIKERRLNRTTCPHCSTRDSFTVSTFGNYFHFFWIPIIPLFKKHVAECSHCRKSYAYSQFTPDMRHSLEVENRNNPAKRPIWQGCGCLVITVLFTIVMSLSLYGVYLRSNGEELFEADGDSRKVLLKEDMEKRTTLLHRERDSLSFALKSCIEFDIVSGLDTENIGYFTKKLDDKLLVLLKIRNIDEIKAHYRKDIVDVIEDCIDEIDLNNTIGELYIGVEGKWNMVLIKTPTDADLGGRFADENKLLPFYGPEEFPANTEGSNTDDAPEK